MGYQQKKPAVVKQADPPRPSLEELRASFNERASAYAAASTIVNKMAALEQARDLVSAEIQHRVLEEEQNREGFLTEDKHKVQSSVRGQIMKMRSAMGLLDLEKKKAASFLGGG